MRRWLFPILLLWPVALAAQTDDRSYLTAFLEDNLSDIGRTVTITGFAGALSSQATITSMTIADKDGVWLTLNGVALDWNRAALFSGEVSVNALTAQEIIVARAPIKDVSALPSPEASGFSLPDLPVSIEIGRIAADRIVLGAPVMGTTVEGTFAASLSLAGGEGQANLALDRTDNGPEGKVSLTASYSNASRQLVLDLDATEAADGIAATLLGIPGTPSASLTVKGSGSVDDFTADIALATDGQDRLAGTLILGGSADGAMQFSADLAGDLAPVFVPKYAEFFGSDVALVAKGARGADGRTALSEVSIKTKALALSGNLAIAADGAPTSFSLTAKLASPDGNAVLLPLTSDQETRVSSADLTLSFDGAKSDDWTVKGTVEGFDRPTVKITRLLLDGSGRIINTADGQRVEFKTSYGASGLAPTDQALAKAIGPAITGSANGVWTERSGELQLSGFELKGDAVALTASGTMQGPESSFAIDGKINADIADMRRFSAIAGRPLVGQAKAEMSGTGNLLGGTFDLDATIDGTDLGIGQAEVDTLLRGQSRIEASVLRSESGTELQELIVTAATLQATAAGKIASAGSDLVANLRFTDLAAMGRQYRGALSAKATLTGTPLSGKITLDGQGTDLAVGQADADKLLRGTSTLSAKLDLRDGAIIVKDARLSNPQITATASAPNGAASQIDLTAKLANLGLLLPEFPGSVTVSGTAKDGPSGIVLNLRALGPGQINATAAGTVSKSGIADLAIKGTGQAALANAFIEPRAISGGLGFDLRLNGPFRPASLSGKISLSGGRVTSPDLPFALQDTAIAATLSGGQAQISGQAAVSTGGSITIGGSLNLASPNTANLSVGMRDVVLRDPQLYETRASGTITVIGPLAGGAVIAGQVDLRDTELQIPSSGLGGVEAIPDLRHLQEPKAVRATRARAGLLGTAGGDGRQAALRAYGLDITISAPNRVFLRGRGLDAELGGSLRLRGSTANVVPDGSFNLIRGRLDILGKRLVLTEAQLRLEGDFVPFVRIAASTESDGVTSSVLIEGLTSDPKVSFTSSPALPQEEVLARLLFGRGLETLSAFQAAQLAGAVASLAGKGGEGIVAKLRKGFGLDDLDVRTDEAGTASVRAGKYIARNVYSEIEVDQTGKSQIQLNLDVTDSITLRGRVGSDGETGLGVFLENDY
jgi:translocation and assembly module TamB